MWFLCPDSPGIYGSSSSGHERWRRVNPELGVGGGAGQENGEGFWSGDYLTGISLLLYFFLFLSLPGSLDSGRVSAQ